jgi:hypothetical protein
MKLIPGHLAGEACQGERKGPVLTKPAVGILILMFWMEWCDSERSSDFPKVTQQVSNKDKIQTPVLILSPIASASWCLWGRGSREIKETG